MEEKENSMSKPFKSELDCYMTDKMICPYCYKECEDESYYVVRNADNTIEYTCEHCDKRFWVYAQLDIHYITTKMDKDGSEITECVLDNALKNSSLNESYYDRLLDEIDNQIKQLKEMK